MIEHETLPCPKCGKDVECEVVVYVADGCMQGDLTPSRCPHCGIELSVWVGDSRLELVIE